MGSTSIEWTNKTWSPLRVQVRDDAGAIAKQKGYGSLVQIAEDMAGAVGPHCEPMSHGCDHCYAEANNGRCLPANGTGLPYDRRSRDLVEPFVDTRMLALPLSWRKPQNIFVENQSDLFGDWNSDSMVDAVLAVAVACPQHNFQILTKREKRMVAYFADLESRLMDLWELANDVRKKPFPVARAWPLKNLWVGVSAEDQPTAERRIVELLKIKAAVHFVSYEPALERVKFHKEWLRKLAWLIIGGESGHQARRFELDWAREPIKLCGEFGTALFMKQMGGNLSAEDLAYMERKSGLKMQHKKGGDPKEWAPEFRVRQFPGEKR